MEDSVRTRSWLDLLRHRDFMLLWSGFAVSSMGTALSNLAFPILTLAVTNSPTMVGLVSAARAVPYLVLSLPAGVIVDRWDRRGMMIWVDALRFLALLSIPAAYIFGSVHVAHLAIVAFIEGAGHVLYATAQVSATPVLLPSAQVARGNALNESADSLANIVGPGLSGAIIALTRTPIIGGVVALAIDAVTYLLSAIALLFIRSPFGEPPSTSTESVKHDLIEGLRFLWRHRLLRLLLVTTSLINFCQAPYYIAIIVQSERVFDENSVSLGLVFTAAGVVALATTVFAPRLYERLSLVVIIVASTVGWALSAFWMAVAPSLWVLGIGFVVTSAIWPIYAVALVTYRQQAAPNAMQGRVTSSFRSVSYGIEPLGMALGGLVIGAFGARPTFTAAGVVLTVTAVFTAVRWATAAGQSRPGGAPA